MSSSYKHREDVFVVLRADLFQGLGAALEQVITAKQVVRSPSWLSVRLSV